MEFNKKIMVATMTAVFGVSLSMTVITSAQAADKKMAMEQCYGIAKAGHNDCGAKNSNACTAQSKVNNDPNAWIFVPKGTCDKIVGGSLTPKDGSSKKPV